ncbi:MAG: GNAT family N-acetyltransferase, partial [Rhodospirillales bacterium]|nr:GNAT family N-acetyltransferase [Rhodospirillales bacterium]
DRVPVRSMVAEDLPQIIRIDRRITGRDRSAYLSNKADEALMESGIRISIVAEQDGRPAGYIMARLDFGEFGHTDSEAVIDTLGVDPGYTHHHIGSALLSQLFSNLAALNVEQVRTELEWDNFELLAFLRHCGFHPSQRLALSRIVD